jgi:hypothetical protein
MGGERAPGSINTEDRPLDINDGTTKRTTGSPARSSDGSSMLSEGGGTAVDAKKHVDSRSDDDNFLLCLALTYLGLPPETWKTIVSHMLEATSEEYKEQLGAKGPEEYEKFKTDFKAMSAINKFKKVIVFIADGTVGPAGTMYIKNTRAVALRAAVIRWLERAGIRMGVLEGASQIVRRVSLYLELVYLSDCAAYCAGTIGAKTIVDFSVNAMAVVGTSAQVVGQGITDALTAVIARPVLVARAMVDSSNWDTTPMPTGALVVKLLGNSIFSQLKSSEPDTFLVYMGHQISTFKIPPTAIAEAAAAMTKTIQTRDGVRVVFTPQLIEGLTPLAFAQLLKEWSLIKFIKDPALVADEQLAKKKNDGNG